MQKSKPVGFLNSLHKAMPRNERRHTWPVTRSPYTGPQRQGHLSRIIATLITTTADCRLTTTHRMCQNIIQHWVADDTEKTARCKEFQTPKAVSWPSDVMQGIRLSLVVIGGDGSLTGARIFATIQFPHYRSAGARLTTTS